MPSASDFESRRSQRRVTFEDDLDKDEPDQLAAVEESEARQNARLAEAIGESLAQQSSWKAETPAKERPAVRPRLRHRREQQLSWRERRKEELRLAREQGNVKAHPCERLVMFLIVFGCLLLLSAALRLQSGEVMQELAQWASQGQTTLASEEDLDVCTDETCEG
eukprot:TRINITY_DN93269_c0_g1_i1.p1 TRINITY_DN93269_c0_g1~~TRINITY_DN93269_c0_g1_i1.p1  ORF type:complete len:181 (+),score=42.62 TRINITY_DN93269_c0_g1_i1:49-543(+)